MVNNLIAYFSCPVNICLTGSEVTTLDHIIEQPVSTVPVILIVFCSIYSSLSCDRVCPPGRILITECFYTIPEFPKSRRRCCSRQTCTYDNYFKFFLICRVYKFNRSFIVCPFHCQRTIGYL